MSSVKLALVLLIAILGCCIAGVTVWRGDDAGRLIFGTLWFNGLLVLLVVNVAFCFFPRMWGRKLTLTSFGMILFHLSFVALLGGIVFNSLFYFRGLIRLTEGETLPSGKRESYDVIEQGRFFDLSKLKGEATLIRMRTGYKIGKEDKRAAYEVAVGEPGSKTQGIIYITHRLDHKGFSYFNDREGYSVLVILYDKLGRELYGAHIPLQSLNQKDGSYIYTTGTKYAPGSLPFPQNPLEPIFALQVAFKPTRIEEKTGNAFFRIWSLRHDISGTTDPHATAGGPNISASSAKGAEEAGDKSLAEGKAAVGEKFRAGDHYLSVREIRYWVAMTVRYEPGKPIVLTSLWVGLAGMVMTFISRLRKRKQRSAISDQQSANG